MIRAAVASVAARYGSLDFTWIPAVFTAFRPDAASRESVSIESDSPPVHNTLHRSFEAGIHIDPDVTAG